MENLHIYSCGKTGSGKSTFLKNELFAEILQRDRAIVFIDPHGHDALDLLDRLPRKDFHRTVLMDFADPNFVVSFNPLTAGAVHTLSGLKSIWLESWGPRMNNILRYALLVLEQIRWRR
jgi:DNA helicase HerA-like ATPase